MSLRNSGHPLRITFVFKIVREMYFYGLYLLSHSTNKNRIFVSADACNTSYDYLLITRTLLIFFAGSTAPLSPGL
jgi:hypothetical protein